MVYNRPQLIRGLLILGCATLIVFSARLNEASRAMSRQSDLNFAFLGEEWKQVSDFSNIDCEWMVTIYLKPYPHIVLIKSGFDCWIDYSLDTHDWVVQECEGVSEKELKAKLDKFFDSPAWKE